MIVYITFSGVTAQAQAQALFYSLRKAKNFYMTVPFMYNFRRLSNKFPKISKV